MTGAYRVLFQSAVLILSGAILSSCYFDESCENPITLSVQHNPFVDTLEVSLGDTLIFDLSNPLVFFPPGVWIDSRGHDSHIAQMAVVRHYNLPGPMPISDSLLVWGESPGVANLGLVAEQGSANCPFHTPSKSIEVVVRVSAID